MSQQDISFDKRISRRVSSALFSSLQAGVTPRVGLDFIVVGRKNEITALLGDLEIVREGGAAFRVITGRYGSGKSFLLQLMRNYAMDRNYVVADADLSPERRLTGSKGQGVATYRELVNNLSTRTRPEGGALKALLEKWISAIQQDVVQSGIMLDDARFVRKVENQIHEVTSTLENLVHGFDFATVISAYYRGYREENDDLQAAALKWLRAEYATKTEARHDLGVRVIVDDDYWYDYLKLLAEFVALVGYDGLIVVIDEAVNLFKISHTISRTNNYEKLLTILNDTLQGKAQHLAVFLGGTPAFLDDERRGLYSYEALKSRLKTSEYSVQGRRDMSTPVIMLDPLQHEELFALLRRVRELHAIHYGYEPTVADDELLLFMEEILNRVGAKEFTTPRAVLRDFVTILNLLQQHTRESFLGIIKGDDFTPSQDNIVEATQNEFELDQEYEDFNL